VICEAVAQAASWTARYYCSRTLAQSRARCQTRPVRLRLQVCASRVSTLGGLTPIQSSLEALPTTLCSMEWSACAVILALAGLFVLNVLALS
jgi:hypothetical protein